MEIVHMLNRNLRCLGGKPYGIKLCKSAGVWTNSIWLSSCNTSLEVIGDVLLAKTENMVKL